MEIKQLKIAGYTPRMVCSIAGLQKTGKTHFGLSAPKGLFYANFDKSSMEDVLPKFQGQFIEARNYWLDEYTKEEAVKVWDVFWGDFHDALNTDGVRTIVVDTLTEARGMKLISLWGKDNQLLAVQYTPAHNAIRQLMAHVNTSNKNVIFVHQFKKEYLMVKTARGEDSAWTGRYELSGYDRLPYLVQVNLETLRRTRPDGQGMYPFGVKIIDCSINPDLIGVELEGEMSNFQTMGTLVFPETTAEDWV